MSKKHYNDAVVVSIDFRHGDGVDQDIMVVGKRRENGDMQVVNAFEGNEAKELWAKLTVVKGAPKVR